MDHYDYALDDTNYAASAPDEETEVCPRCDGQQFIEFDYRDGGDGITACPVCDGVGRVYRDEVASWGR
jgi:hypothetical protein